MNRQTKKQTDGEIYTSLLANKYDCTSGTRNWYITLNAVHDIHLHTLFFNYHEVSQIISTLNAHAA